MALSLRRLRGILAAALLLACSGAAALAGSVTPLGVGSPAFDLAFGSAVGGMLCRTASGWAVIAAGNANQVLTVPSGGGCPTWANMAVASTGGNVSTTGSPTAGQIAAFTDATHVQGVGVVPVAADPAPADDCVRVSVASTTSLALKPLGCNTVWIGGAPATIPAGGVTLSGQTALTSGTLYYVYAQASGGAVSALSLSTTGHVTGSDGREYLNASGSPNTAYRLVAMLYTNTAAAPFLDAPATRFLLNWFKRRNLPIASTLAQASTASTSELYLGNGAALFLTWADETPTIDVYGSTYNSSTNALQTVYAAIDGVNVSAPSYAANASANQSNAHAALGSATVAEGAHNGTAGVLTNGGTATYSLAVRGSTRG